MTANSSVADADPFDLARFVDAQNDGQTYSVALGEISRGRKVSHWMWFVYPQVAGLGRSATARRFAIRSLEEARAYAAHPVLGARLRESAKTMLTAPGASADAVLGGTDAVKLRSSMTLFAEATDDAVFTQVLDRWFHGVPDEATVTLLHRN
ncbi:uncharacterized protein (DUF1810 family) [Frondihabitans sp. PhB188]|uniref:DUF1810 domain-containing protein n=1 Tax=Frondihabitans sp. PhB188 TaxID=2485200 RepID=UPI000F484F33|nr:DUF1810 domain-containing protein [Frondihabitans sp. PhB188]ROQ37244.1 uncharacterized protein (DUF1810 family) [Frondihabitans sp. PhB188]